MKRNISGGECGLFFSRIFGGMVYERSSWAFQMDINATEVPFQAGLFRVINKQRITVLGDYEGTSMRLFAVDFHVENRSKTMAKILWPNGMRTA